MTESRRAVASESQVAFHATPLDRAIPSGFEWISAPASFVDARKFDGRFYLCGSAALFAYDADGRMVARYRAGLELPAAPLVALASGVTVGAVGEKLWIATAGQGLLSFDGRRFEHIRPREEGYRALTALLPLRSGGLLLGTAKKGILVYDGERIAPFHASLTGFSVTTLAGEESDLWVGTLDRGVLRFHAGQLERFGEADGMPDERVTSLAAAGDLVYAGTSMGVAEFRGGKFSRVLARGFFGRSLLPRADSLLVGTMEEGVIDVPLQAKARGAGRSGCDGCAEVVRLLDIDGSVYTLAKDGLFLRERNGEQRAVLTAEKPLLTDANISALAVDSSRRLWVGYFDRGLDIAGGDGSRASHIENEVMFCVNRIVPESGGGRTAVATANGLVMFDRAGHERQVLRRADGLIANHVTDVIFRSGGMVAATSAGITIFDAAGPHSLYAFHGLVNNHVYALGASGSRLLAGTLGGVSLLDGDVVRAGYTTANSGLKHNWITAIAPAGQEWFAGTYGAGVLRLDEQSRWQTFADLQPDFVVNPNAMLATGRAIYAGTMGRGLAVYRRDSQRWSMRTAGLPSMNVTALAAQGEDIYIGTDNGLVRAVEGSLVER